MSVLNTTPEAPVRGGQAVLLIDADYFAYMVGSICQNKIAPHGVTGCEYVCTDADADIWVWVYPKGLVEWNVDNVITKIKDKLDSDNVELYLTGGGNFREQVAVSRPYKGSRKGARPYWWQHIRDYMVSELGAEVIDGIEADDHVCIRQLELMSEGVSSVIVSNDKDLLNMFGWNYNPRTETLTWVTAGAAERHFWRQMVTGDTVDNIPGIKGCGPKWADQLLRLPLDLVSQIVYDEYDLRHSYDYMLEQGQLLHMLRRLGEEWSPEYDFEAGYVAAMEHADDRPYVVETT